MDVILIFMPDKKLFMKELTERLAKSLAHYLGHYDV